MAPTETPTRVQALGYSGVPVASPVFGVLVTPQDEDEMARLQELEPEFFRQWTPYTLALFRTALGARHVAARSSPLSVLPFEYKAAARAFINTQVEAEGRIGAPGSADNGRGEPWESLRVLVATFQGSPPAWLEGDPDVWTKIGFGPGSSVPYVGLTLRRIAAAEAAGHPLYWSDLLPMQQNAVIGKPGRGGKGALEDLGYVERSFQNIRSTPGGNREAHIVLTEKGRDVIRRYAEATRPVVSEDRPTAGSLVDVAGAHFTVTRVDPYGTVFVQNEQGVEFDLNSADLRILKVLRAGPAAIDTEPAVGGRGAWKMTRDAYVEQELRRELTEAQAQLRDQEQADVVLLRLNEIKLPVGIGASQYIEVIVGERKRPPQWAKDAARTRKDWQGRVASYEEELRKFKARKDEEPGREARMFGDVHKVFVEQAKQAGFPVPAEVLKDYAPPLTLAQKLAAKGLTPRVLPEVKKNPALPRHLRFLADLTEARHAGLEAYFPETAAGTMKPKHRGERLFAADGIQFLANGDGTMVPIEAANLEAMSENEWDRAKFSALVEAIEGREEPVVIPGYADLDMEHGALTAQVRDGNHRTFAPIAAGGGFSWVLMSDSTRQELNEDPKRTELLYRAIRKAQRERGAPLFQRRVLTKAKASPALVALAAAERRSDELDQIIENYYVSALQKWGPLKETAFGPRDQMKRAQLFWGMRLQELSGAQKAAVHAAPERAVVRAAWKERDALRSQLYALRAAAGLKHGERLDPTTMQVVR